MLIEFSARITLHKTHTTTRICSNSSFSVPHQVFYSNGRQPATKLQREKQTKVFDYRGKFIPTLRESRNGNCEYPAYDVTFYLGKADSSLVSIVVTHTKARTNVRKASTTGEKFLSEPNLNDQLATSLEQDCMY